jgi:hypothetical protein
LKWRDSPFLILGVEALSIALIGPAWSTLVVFFFGVQGLALVATAIGDLRRSANCGSPLAPGGPSMFLALPRLGP